MYRAMQTQWLSQVRGPCVGVPTVKAIVCDVLYVFLGEVWTCLLPFWMICLRVA